MDAALHTTGSGRRSDHAYHHLKQRLLAGEYPLGRRLAEESLAATLAMSRTPVREALSRLEAEGLVARHPSGGFEPAAPDLHAVAELYEVRFALELDALDRPGRTGATHDRDALEDLRSEWTEWTDAMVEPASANPDFVLLDEDFHVRLALAAGNGQLADVLTRVNERIRPVRMQDFLTADRIARTVDQHLGIVQALLDGHPAMARHLLQAHLDESLAVVGDRAARALARMVGAVAGARR